MSQKEKPRRLTMAADQKTLYDERIATSPRYAENHTPDEAQVSSIGKVILISTYLLSAVGLIIASLLIH